ncbi:hypothetical protein EOL96_01915 [Candidatus Saccharibacteria bacterium]|nr:hypothetical protein [Candidatus Saccharibacteria bacterium]
MKNRLSLLLVDFDGVTSVGRFYATNNMSENALSLCVSDFVFSKDNKKLVQDWMRGKLRYQDLHRLVEKKQGIGADQLDDLLKRSVKEMKMNSQMLAYLQKLRKQGIVVSLFTDNMDIFDTVSRYHHELDSQFDYIYSSSMYGQLKLENDTLLKKAIYDARTRPSEVAFVDDSTEAYEKATKYGIKTFVYGKYVDSQPDFEAWVGENFIM